LAGDVGSVYLLGHEAIRVFRKAGLFWNLVLGFLGLALRPSPRR
jgi:hypothetical protein